MADLIGQTLGNYEILSLLGEGGMASVYRARQLNIQRFVAVKVIKAGVTNIEQFAQRFVREVRVIAGLNHPHIIKVFDYGEQNGLAYLVMEFQSGGSLADLIDKGPLPLQRASTLLEQIASALDYAHRQGVIHRDLKPQNILLDADGNAILTDFGIAKIFDTNTALTQSGTLVGTPAYMAPEQWQGRPIDARADIYALGIVLYEMISGRLPFEGETPFSVMHKHIYDQPASIIGYRPELPQPVDQVIKKALAKDREQRFATAGEFAQAFRAALAGQAPEVAPVSLPTYSGEANRTVPPAPAAANTVPGTGNQSAWLVPVGIVIAIILLGAVLILPGRLASTTPTAAVAALVSATPTSQPITLTATSKPITLTATSLPPTLTATLLSTSAATTAPPSKTLTLTTAPPTATQTLDPRETQLAQQANAQNTNVAATLQSIAALQSQFTLAAQQTATGQAVTRTAQTTAIAITPTRAASATFTATLQSTQPPVASPTITKAPTVTKAPTLVPPTVAPTSAPTSAATAVPSIGVVTFSDKANNGKVNALTLTINNIPLAGEGRQYAAWLSDRQNPPISVGKLNVKADGTALLNYVDPKGANLLITYSAVLITVQAKDSNAFGTVAFSGSIPAQANVHVQHVIARFPDTPGNIGLLNGALQQDEIMSDHVQLLSDAVNKNSVVLARLHLEHIHNIMTGKDGAQDLNNDGKLTISPPGDGYGLFNYLTNAVEHAQLASQQSDATDAVKASAEAVMISAANASTTLTQMQTLVLDAAAKKTISEMKPLIAQIVTLNNTVLNGTPDSNGKVTATKGSGGLGLAYSAALTMASFPIFPGAAVTSAPSSATEAGNATAAPSATTVQTIAVDANATVVVLQDMAFAPANITIKAGGSVVFNNTSEREHTATADDNSFDTGVVAPGARSKPIKFDKPGTYPFYCQFHGGPGGVGMSGVITVQK